MKPTIEETNEILDDLGYEHHGYALPKTIEELHDFHVKCIETIAGGALNRR